MVPRLEGAPGIYATVTHTVLFYCYTPFVLNCIKSSFPRLFSHARKTGGSFGTYFRILNTECCREDLLGQVSLLTTFAHILVRCRVDQGALCWPVICVDLTSGNIFVSGRSPVSFLEELSSPCSSDQAGVRPMRQYDLWVILPRYQ